MLNRLTIALLVIFGIICTGNVVQAVPSTDDISWKTILIEPVTKGDISQQVVLVYVYDADSAGWQDQLPTLLNYAKAYEHKLHVLILASPSPPESELQVAAIAYGIKCSVLVNGEIKGYAPIELPVCLLFDHEGALVKESKNAALLKKEISKLVKKAPNPVTKGQTEQFPELKKELKRIASMKALGKVCAGLEKTIAEEADSDKGTQAQELLDRLVKYGEKLLSRAETMMPVSMVTAADKIKAVATLYKGHELGDKAKARHKEITSTEDYKREVKALNMATVISKKTQSINPDKAPVPLVKELIKHCDVILINFPETEGERIASILKTALLGMLPNNDGGGGYGDGEDGGIGGGGR